jgi:hypothetical protein
MLLKNFNSSRTMSQNSPSIGETERIRSEGNSLSENGGDISGSERKSRSTDVEEQLAEGASEELKVEWKRFFDELEAWQGKQYEQFIEGFRETAPNLEPPPRRDKDWRDIVYNKYSDILSGTAPPLPPCFPAVALEEVKEKVNRQARELDLLVKEKDEGQTELDQNHRKSD